MVYRLWRIRSIFLNLGNTRTTVANMYKCKQAEVLVENGV